MDELMDRFCHKRCEWIAKEGWPNDQTVLKNGERVQRKIKGKLKQ